MPTLNIRSIVSQTLRAAQLPGARFGSKAGQALLLLAFAGTAAAQQAPSATQGTETLEEVVVTGIRHGIEGAIEVKHDSTSIVEAISAEDIGKLPDTSIAESLSRLPGVTSQRANGRASALSVRGTDPAFTTALLNGREQVSTGDNRSIEFDQYPSELLSGAVVYKTPDSQLIGQGLAGTIDMQTTRPIEYGKRALVFNARAERNSNNDLGANSSDKGYRLSLSYIDQFFDKTVGVAIGLARLNSPLATEGVGAYEPWQPNTNANNGVPLGVFFTNGMKVRTDMGDNTRTGALATIEFKPNASFTATIDGYYTKSDETDDARSLEWNLSNYPANETFTNLVIRDNTLVGASVSGVRPLVRNFQFITNDKIAAVGGNAKWVAGDWTLIGDLSWSKATRDQFQPETNSQWGNCAQANDPACLDTGQFLLNGGQSMPSATFIRNYADQTQVAFGNTIYGAGYVKKPHVEDELKSARIDVAHTGYGWFDLFAASVNYSDRSKNKSSPETGLNLNPGVSSVNVDPKYLYSPTDLNYAGAGSVLAWNVPAVLAAYYQPISYCDPVRCSYLVGKWWTVTEKVTTGSLRGNLNHDLSSNVTLKGNLGVQIINTKQDSDSYFINDAKGGAVTPFSAGKKYTDVLPQINLAFMLPEQQAVRVSLAREMARPRMDQLKASIDEGASQINGLPGGSGGNPFLDPWRANAFDLSYEKYFGNKGYFSAAVFYKDLKSYIYDSTNENADFSTLVNALPPGYFPPGVTPSLTGPLTQPLNGSGGKLKGVEFSLSLPGEMLGEGLRGFGTILSLSQTYSNITINDPATTQAPGTSQNILPSTGLGNIPLPGLSRTVWNATFYYENGGFETRIATRARSKYIGEIVNFANDRAFRYVKGDQITDFQTSYAFESGALKGFQLLFQVNNLTNSPYVAYIGTEARLIDYQTYGRQFLAGFNYKL